VEGGSDLRIGDSDPCLADFTVLLSEQFLEAEIEGGGGSDTPRLSEGEVAP